MSEPTLLETDFGLFAGGAGGACLALAADQLGMLALPTAFLVMLLCTLVCGVGLTRYLLAEV